MKGYVISDEELRKAKGYNILDYMYSRNPIIYSSINDVTSSMFNIFREDHFDLVCTQPKVMRLFAELVSRHPIEGLYGNQFHGLDDFLSNVFKSLITFGKVFTRIDYSQAQIQGQTAWKIQRIRWLPAETMRVVHKKGEIKGFVQQYSKICQDERLCKKTEFTPDEIFFVEWMFDGRRLKGVSPLLSLIPHAKRHLKFLKVMERKTYAMANPQDHSFKIERAKYASWEKEKRLNEISELRIRSTIGAWSDAPMTEYYGTFRFAKSRQRIAAIREYLLTQFNQQVVNTLSRKNGLNESVEIKLKGYLTSSEIGQLIQRFQNGQISQNEMITTLQKDMAGRN
jgi:hypothetical protein